MGEHDFADLDRQAPRTVDLEAAILGPAEVALFENLYVAYAADARRVARAILRDTDLAADAVHSGFLEMLRYVLGGSRWYDPAEARAMVLRNVRWAALKAQRARGRLSTGVHPSAPSAGDDVEWARSEARALCEQVVSRLAANHRNALRARYVEGLSDIDAARRLGVSVDVYEARMRRAVASARRAARSTGLLPRLAAMVASGGGRTRRRRPPLPRVGRAAGATLLGAAGTALAMQTLLVAGAPAGSPLAVAMHLTAATRAAAPASIDEAHVLDAVALPSSQVFILAEERDCRCRVLFRSPDMGATWEPVAAAPASLPEGQHPQPCGPRSANAYCRGGAVPDGQGGLLLPLPAGHMLFFASTEGVYCSGDGGRSWGQRCPG